MTQVLLMIAIIYRLYVRIMCFDTVQINCVLGNMCFVTVPMNCLLGNVCFVTVPMNCLLRNMCFVTRECVLCHGFCGLYAWTLKYHLYQIEKKIKESWFAPYFIFQTQSVIVNVSAIKIGRSGRYSRYTASFVFKLTSFISLNTPKTKEGNRTKPPVAMKRRLGKS